MLDKCEFFTIPYDNFTKRKKFSLCKPNTHSSIDRPAVILA